MIVQYIPLYNTLASLCGKYGCTVHTMFCTHFCSIFKSGGVTHNGVCHNYAIANKYGHVEKLHFVINSVIETYFNAIYALYNSQYVVKMGFDGIITDSTHIKNIDDVNCYCIKTDGVNIYAFFENETGYIVKKIDHELKTITVLETPFP